MIHDLLNFSVFFVYGTVFMYPCVSVLGLAILSTNKDKFPIMHKLSHCYHVLSITNDRQKMIDKLTTHILTRQQNYVFLIRTYLATHVSSKHEKLNHCSPTRRPPGCNMRPAAVIINYVYTVKIT